MKGKISGAFLWVLSIFFLLSTFVMFSTTWASVLFIVPAVLLNPAINNILRNKCNFNSRWWVKLCSVLIPVIIYSAVAPAVPDATSTIPASSMETSSAILSSALPSESSSVSSSAVSSQAPSSVEMAAPTPTSGAKLNVHYIDVGQGDSEFIELPNGQTMLIDAGNPENGDQIVSYIKSLKHSKIDYLVATHPHADHIGGMETVVKGLDIGKIYMPKVSANTQTFEDLLTAIQSKGLKVNTAKAGVNIIKAGNLSADIIAPVNITGDDLNQYSAVILLTYGDNKFLFTGDAGEESEAQITSDIKADVLKVGHHGSDTSTSQSFLDKVHPKYAVIEVGKDNTYGHPTAETLAKLQNIGATIYRTDNDGTIIFTSDAKTITVNKKASSIKENAPPAKVEEKPAAEEKPAVEAPKEQAPEAVAPPAADNQSVVVYVTKTGGKYHTGGCRYLRKSKIEMSLADAKASGYEPCSVCNPPQ